MGTLITLLGLFFLIAAVVGVISPKTVLGKWGNKLTRFQTFMLFIFLFIVCVVGGSQLSQRDYEARKRKAELDIPEKKQPQTSPQPATKPESANMTPPKAAAPKPIETPRPQAAKQENPSVSYEQVMKNLSNVFMTMKQGTFADGRARYSGGTSDHLAQLEIIGDKTDIDSASLLIAAPKDSEKIRQRNFALALLFIKNTVPEWKDRDTWIAQAIKLSLTKTTLNKSSIMVGDKKITVSPFSNIGPLIAVEIK